MPKPTISTALADAQQAIGGHAGTAVMGPQAKAKARQEIEAVLNELQPDEDEGTDFDAAAMAESIVDRCIPDVAQSIAQEVVDKVNQDLSSVSVTS